MVETTIKRTPNTASTQKAKVSLNNDKICETNGKFVSTGFNHETLSVRKAAEIFSSITLNEENGKNSSIRRNKINFQNDEKDKYGFVGYLKDVGRTFGLKSPNETIKNSNKFEHSQFMSSRDIKINQSRDSIIRKPIRKKSLINARVIEKEEQLVSPINIYLEHRDHLEQDKRARVNLDVLKEEIYVPKNQILQSFEPLSNPCGLLDIKFFLNIGYGGNVIGLGNNMWGMNASLNM
ncbi:5036_t:CDS:2 [Funneliformis geosporum]|nr:5036_t:CDS:2 [Funneliformis geosporum]